MRLPWLRRRDDDAAERSVVDNKFYNVGLQAQTTVNMGTNGRSPWETRARDILRDAVARSTWTGAPDLDMHGQDWPQAVADAVVAACEGRHVGWRVVERSISGQVMTVQYVPVLVPLYSRERARSVRGKLLSAAEQQSFQGWSDAGGDLIPPGDLVVLTAGSAADGGPDAGVAQALVQARALARTAGWAQMWTLTRQAAVLTAERDPGAPRPVDPAAQGPQQIELQRMIEAQEVATLFASPVQTAILPPGLKDAHYLGGNENPQMLVESIDASARAVGAVYGVPAGLIGGRLPREGGYADLERAFARTTVAGWQRRVLEAWRPVLLPGHDLGIAPSPAATDQNTIEVLDQLRNAHMLTVNEAREALGLDKLFDPRADDAFEVAAADGGAAPEPLSTNGAAPSASPTMNGA